MKDASLTPAMKQFHRFKREHPDAILFFRMGDFYEMFYEDARTASRVLGITLTSRTKGVPMAGVPYHAAASYIQKLIKANLKVAICEQVQDPKEAKGVVDRDVVQVMTPGTLTDDGMLDDKSANHLACLLVDGERAGLAWVELSTGQFVVHETLASEVPEVLSLVAPSEVLLAEGDEDPDGLQGWLAQNPPMVTRRPAWVFGMEEAHRALTTHFQTQDLDGFGCGDLTVGVCAAGALMAYLNETQRVHLSHISRLVRWHPESFMHIDRSTRGALELTRTMRMGERQGTLLWVLDHTVTAMGARMLNAWVLAPLRDASRIRERLDGVEELFTQGLLRNDLRDALAGVHDMERLTTKVATERANARDLLALGQSLSALPALKQRLADVRSDVLAKLRERVDPVGELASLVARAVAPEPPVLLTDGGLIRAGYSQELDELRAIASGGRDWLAKYQADEAKRTGIPSLRIGFNKVFGFYIEVTHAHGDKVPDDYTRKQTLKNAERYITPQLKEYESRVLSADERSKSLEFDLFVALRKEAGQYVVRLQRTARALAALDVLTSLAQVAAENRYARPTLVDEPALTIRDGRHPVLERTLQREKFVPNDTDVDCDARQLAIITGPNMAGKSTYIRQVALIVLMAQMGSFVPAASATVGTVDRIFTRVGASDELARGHSTFMVEMTETANILNNATKRSLIILDEIGRGTSTFDGLSIAWAVAEFIHQRIGARTLFATHYHELTELALLLPRVVNLNIAVKEWKDEVIFLRKIVEGATDKSYGIHVARLAGIPDAVVTRSRSILENLEKNELDIRGKPRLARRDGEKKRPQSFQLTLFTPRYEDVAEDLRQLDLDAMTPLDALVKLKELRERIKSEGGEG